MARSMAVLTACLFLASAARAADFPRKGTITTKGPEGMTWAVTFDDKGKFVVKLGDKEVVNGTYKVNKDEIELTDEGGEFAGKGDAKTGTYKWKLDGKKMKFTVVKDSADGRKLALTGSEWELKE